MIAILEGADGTGKTAAARALGAPTLAYGAPGNAGWVGMYLVRVLDALEGDPELLVLDRSFIGSRVWSEVGLHRPILGEDDWNAVCRAYAQLGARAFIVIRDKEDISATILARDFEGPADVLLALAGQAEFIDLAVAGLVRYMPVQLISSDLLHAEPEILKWN